MRDFAHPPGPGISREVASMGQLAEQHVDDPTRARRLWREFIIRCETIRACGLIAEVRAENGYVTLFATRRVRKGGRE